MNNLKSDEIKFITNFLNLENILNFSLINKEIFNILDEVFYNAKAIENYGKYFWFKALNRTRYISEVKPLKYYKYELMRIELFQNMLNGLEIKRWSPSDFYNYWKINDKNFCK